MECLEQYRPLDRRYLDHALNGHFPNQRSGQTGCRECHVSNDWLLVTACPTKRASISSAPARIRICSVDDVAACGSPLA
jgi:mRNA-degrading endonuclease YafQ of YafQ-DinJ toxin-antitoxin module